MTNKILSADCLNCESQYSIDFMEEEVSQELPEHCPFCGEYLIEAEDFEEEDE